MRCENITRRDISSGPAPSPRSALPTSPKTLFTPDARSWRHRSTWWLQHTQMGPPAQALVASLCHGAAGSAGKQHGRRAAEEPIPKASSLGQAATKLQLHGKAPGSPLLLWRPLPGERGEMKAARCKAGSCKGHRSPSLHAQGAMFLERSQGSVTCSKKHPGDHRPAWLISWVIVGDPWMPPRSPHHPAWALIRRSGHLHQKKGEAG